MASIVPSEIETERLVLRAPVSADAPALQALCANWNVVRMTARMPHPCSLGDAERWIAAQPALREAGREYAFVATLDGAVIGGAGLVAGEPGPELGYWLGESSWGRGLATEAAHALCALAFDRLGAATVTAGHYADNPASGRVLAKCGFRYTGEEMLHSAARGEAALSFTMKLDRADLPRAAERTRS